MNDATDGMPSELCEVCEGSLDFAAANKQAVDGSVRERTDTRQTSRWAFRANKILIGFNQPSEKETKERLCLFERYYKYFVDAELY